jgi:hypothetical protein
MECLSQSFPVITYISMSLPDHYGHSTLDYQHQESEMLLPGGLYNFPEFAPTAAAPVKFSSNSQDVLNSVTGNDNQESVSWNDLLGVIGALESGTLLEEV